MGRIAQRPGPPSPSLPVLTLTGPACKPTLNPTPIHPSQAPMLSSVEGIYEHGNVRLLEPLTGIGRARMVVTVVPEPVNAFQDPLDLPITPEEHAVWEALPQFCAEHPVQFHSLADDIRGLEGSDLRYYGTPDLTRNGSRGRPRHQMTASTYEQDFHQWTRDQAEHLRERAQGSPWTSSTWERSYATRRALSGWLPTNSTGRRAPRSVTPRSGVTSGSFRHGLWCVFQMLPWKTPQSRRRPQG